MGPWVLCYNAILVRFFITYLLDVIQLIRKKECKERMLCSMRVHMSFMNTF